jgi:adenosine deaminase
MLGLLPWAVNTRLPLIDLHRHLDGSIRLETILDLGRRHNIPLPAWTTAELRPHVVVTEPHAGLVEFLAKFQWMIAVLADYDACRRVAYENVEDASREGIRYIELRFSPCFMASHHHLDPSRVVEAVIEGARQGEADFGVRVNLIGILTRTFGPGLARKELLALLDHKEHLVALDLAGDEASKPAGLFVEHFKEGRDAGWQITVHAGEAAGAASIVEAVEKLGATRIGHAVRAVDDPAVMAMLRERRIGIEANLTSNVQTSAVPNLASHPLRQFLAEGLLACINTDDPGISGIDLPHELDVAAPAAGLTPEDVDQTLRNAWGMAFLREDEKHSLISS